MHRLRDPSEGETGGDQSDDADDLLRWGFAYALPSEFSKFPRTRSIISIISKEVNLPSDSLDTKRYSS